MNSKGVSGKVDGSNTTGWFIQTHPIAAPTQLAVRNAQCCKGQREADDQHTLGDFQLSYGLSDVLETLDGKCNTTVHSPA